MIRSTPCVLLRSGCVRRVLMRTGDRGVDGDVPVDLAFSVGQGQQVGQDRVPGTVDAVAAAGASTPSTRNRIPRGKISPRDSGAVAVDDALDDEPTVAKRSASSAIAAG